MKCCLLVLVLLAGCCSAPSTRNFQCDVIIRPLRGVGKPVCEHEFSESPCRFDWLTDAEWQTQ